MKTLSFEAMKNAPISAIQNGMKRSEAIAEPTLVANSTQGKFMITSPVSKALDIPVGGYVMFSDDSNTARQVLQSRPDDIVKYAEENGLDLDNLEVAEEIVRQMTTYFISKGVKKYDSKGNPIYASERFTKEDKKKFIEAHAAEILEANRETLIERVGDENADDETLIAAISVDDVESPQYHAVRGSKCATTGKATGVGVQLNFTDTAIWSMIKWDMGEDATKKNRIFKVDLSDPREAEVDNGKELVKVLAYPLVFVKDEEVVARVGKKD